jgi:undecaprenyl-diphosphatase
MATRIHDAATAARTRLATADARLYAAVAKTDTPGLDRVLSRLSSTADHSKISFAVAAALAVRPGAARHAAALGVAAIGVASAASNILGKGLTRRRRPDPDAAGVLARRRVPMPTSTSFPSGHSASAAAFAVAVGSKVPAAAVPLGALAGAVGYSRVHTGVHYPADVAAGMAIGVLSAGAVLAADRRRTARRAGWLGARPKA